jgi:predicted  nucleic acid-binding Zn-ribbon protein
LEEAAMEMHMKYQNLKNDFLAAQAEVTTLETQMDKERNKLAKLRKDKMHLLKKVGVFYIP